MSAFNFRIRFVHFVTAGLVVGSLIFTGASFAKNLKIISPKIFAGDEAFLNGISQAQQGDFEKQVIHEALADKPVMESKLDYLSLSPPEYPKLARAKGWEGTVLLKVLVDENGRPSGVWIEKSSGYPLLDFSAQKAVQKWKFYPAQHEHIPYACLTFVPVQFVLSELDSPQSSY